MDKKNDLLVKANEFTFTFKADQIDAIDLIQCGDDEFNLIHNQQSVNINILHADSIGKKIKLEADGTWFDIEIKNELDQMLDQMGFGAASKKQIKEIKAPMPGLVLEITVTEGQQVKEGDKMLILEAMKMENSIMIHADAVIKKINIKKGQAVEKGQVLIELE